MNIHTLILQECDIQHGRQQEEVKDFKSHLSFICCAKLSLPPPSLNTAIRHLCPVIPWWVGINGWGLMGVDGTHITYPCQVGEWGYRQHRIQVVRGGGGARNMNYKGPPVAAIFFMTSFNRDRGGHGPLAPPGSAAARIDLRVDLQPHP